MLARLLRPIGFLLLLSALLMLVLAADALGLFAGADCYFYDTLLRIRGERPRSERIAIVAIDAKSLEQFGRWPIPRSTYVRLLSRLDQAAAVGFDLLFMEPSSDDPLFRKALDRHGRVVLAAYLDASGTMAQSLLQSAAVQNGHVHVAPDVDNTVRELAHQIVDATGHRLPSLSSALYDLTGRQVTTRTERVHRGAGHGAITQQDMRKINFYGPPGSFQRISLADLLGNDVPPDFFRDRIVLVGLTAPGGADDVATPFSQARNRMPGVEVHASALNNLLDAGWIRDLSAGWLRLYAFIGALGLAVVLLKLAEKTGALLWLGSLLLFPLLSFWLLTTFYSWLPPMVLLSTFSCSFWATYLYRLDGAARKLDREYAVMQSLLAADEGESWALIPRRGMLSLISEGGINEKVQRLSGMTTRLAQLHKQLAAALKTEREALDSQVRFVEMLSHEYRTPLAIIRANLDILEMKSESVGGQLDGNFSKMKRAVARLVEVMDTSLGRERLEGITAKTGQTECELSGFVQAVFDEAQGLWSEHPLELIISVANPCYLIADHQLLKTAILNLIDNAVKYSSGQVPVLISLTAEGQQAVVSVKNVGAVIAEQDRSRLFEKYFRGGSSVNTQGAGLGLYLVTKIVEQLSGDIWLASSSAEGTVIKISLPVRFCHI